MIQRSEFGIRLTDVNTHWTVDVPARSLDHAEEVTRWHNDPSHESIYQAEIVERHVTITNWQLVNFVPRNVTT